MDTVASDVEKIYASFDGPSVANRYHERHGTQSLGVLTVANASDAEKMVRKFVGEIRGKRVVEVGAGVGYLSLEMSLYASAVHAIEVDVGWSWIFTKYLYATKPKNLTWIFGDANSVCDFIRADVAVVCTRSGAVEMVRLARIMAPIVILIAWDDPLIARAESPVLSQAAEWIDARVARIYAEASAAGAT